MEQVTMKQTFDSFLGDAKAALIDKTTDEDSEIMGRFPFWVLLELTLLGSPEEVLNASLRDALGCKLQELVDNREWDPFEVIEKKAEQGDERCIRFIEKFEELESLFPEFSDD